MIQINNLIAISGRICSGKSFLAKNLSKRLDIQIVSFGSYLFDYSLRHNLPTDRNSLQNLGEKFVTQNPQEFVDKVLLHPGKLNDTIIIEGIRHKSIYEILKDISRSSTFIYVDENVNTRFERYINRAKETDEAIKFEEFLQVDSHVVELGTESLKIHYDIIRKSTDPIDQLAAIIKEKIVG